MSRSTNYGSWIKYELLMGNNIQFSLTQKMNIQTVTISGDYH